MSLLIVTVGVLLLTVPALAARLSLEPAPQVRLACGAASTGIWTLAMGTVLTASPLVMWWHDGDELEAMPVSHLSPGGPWAWAAAGGLATFGTMWCAGSLRRTHITRRRAALPRWAADSVLSDTDAGAEVRVANMATPIAFAVPGRDHHVVISRGLADQLPADGLRAVLAHEGAHLRLRHDRHLLVLSAYQRLWGWLPGVAGVVRAHRDALERWADADAARTRSLPADAFTNARSTLCQPARIAAHESGPMGTTPGWRVAAAWVLLGVLALSGFYATSHAVGDIGSIMAALH